LLIEKGYKNLHGIIRRSSNFNTSRIDHIFDKINLHYGDMTDAMSLYNIIDKVRPDYIVNTAAQSHVAVSAELENYTMQVNTMGVLNILQSVRNLKLTECKIYQCSTSEEWGNGTDGSHLLNENSPKIPVSIYGVSKLAAENICNIYRDAFNMFVVCGTLLNHEGVRRGKTFISAKISDYVGNYINCKTKKPLQLGNVYAKRDWSDSRDMVNGIFLMLMQDKPKNYVLASGTCYSVKQFAEYAFKQIGITIEWNGLGLKEVGRNKLTHETLIQINPKYYRDIDIECLIGDSSLAKKELNWVQKISFNQMVKDMIEDSIEKTK
jgi:GDPmannose 4,6-dehydratase